MKKLILGVMIFLFSFSIQANSLIDQIDKKSNDRTDIFAIYKNNKLIYQEYRNGYQPNQKHKLWSMSKSLTGLILARAVKDQRIKVEDSICQYVSMGELSSAKQCDMTIEDILFWRSGTQWAEDYIGLDGDKSSVLTAHYGHGINNFSEYYFSLPYLEEVPNNWNYSTGDSHMLGYLLRKVYSPMEYEMLPWKLFFDPLEIEDATFERDHQGTYLGGAYVFLSHGNLNKVAQMVLAELEEPSFLPEGWMNYVLKAKPESIFTKKMKEDQKAPAIPGGHWWLNQPTTEETQYRPWPRAPQDTFAAFGVFGQMMFIIPSKELVIIRLAQDIRGGFDRENLLDVALKFSKGVN